MVMSKKWLKIFFRGGSTRPETEWIYGSFSEVKRKAIEDMYEDAYLDLEDDGVSDCRDVYLKELRERENDDCLFLKFKHGCHPRCDMAVISNAALQRIVPYGLGRKRWVYAWVNDDASFEAGEFVIHTATGGKTNVKDLVTERLKSHRPSAYSCTARYSVERLYNPSGFFGQADSVQDHVSYGEGLKILAVPFSEIPERRDNNCFSV